MSRGDTAAGTGKQRRRRGVADQSSGEPDGMDDIVRRMNVVVRVSLVACATARVSNEV